MTRNQTQVDLLFPNGDASEASVVVVGAVQEARYNGALEDSHSKEDCRARELLLVEVDVRVGPAAIVVICNSYAIQLGSFDR